MTMNDRSIGFERSLGICNNYLNDIIFQNLELEITSRFEFHSEEKC